MTLPAWGDAPTSQVPAWAYTDSEVYRAELERLFYRGHWCYVGLECEIPHPGDYKRSVVGERSVVMVRDEAGAVHVVENRCAHRGAAFCRERHGNVKRFVCPYHQWNYALDGSLVGLPFRKGFRSEGRVLGGMPEDFDLGAARPDEAQGRAPRGRGVRELRPRRRTVRGLPGTGYPAVVRPRVPWPRTQAARLQPPAHPGELETDAGEHQGPVPPGPAAHLVRDFRPVARRPEEPDGHGPQAPPRRDDLAPQRRRSLGNEAAATEGVASFRRGMQLNDPRLLDVVPEPWWNGPTVVMMTLFPSLIIQQQVNSLSMRHLQPVAPDEFDFVWTHFGFADDDEAMTTRRLRQANLFGPAGFVSADDGEVIEFVQQAFRRNRDARTFSELDGREVKPTDHMVTETLIRGMYGYWREVMEREVTEREVTDREVTAPMSQQ